MVGIAFNLGFGVVDSDLSGQLAARNSYEP